MASEWHHRPLGRLEPYIVIYATYCRSRVKFLSTLVYIFFNTLKPSFKSEISLFKQSLSRQCIFFLYSNDFDLYQIIPSPQTTTPGRCACVSAITDFWPSPPTATSSAWPLPSSSKKTSCANASTSSREPSCPSELPRPVICKVQTTFTLIIHMGFCNSQKVTLIIFRLMFLLAFGEECYRKQTM